MNGWYFFNERNKPIDRILTNTVKSELIELVEYASLSKPSPNQSNYFVRTAGLTERGIKVKGGNHEKGITDTLSHGEEAVIIAAAEESPNDPLKYIVFSGEHDGIARSCGNCRDSIKERCPDALIANGVKKNRHIHVIDAKRFFFDNFDQFTESDIKIMPGFNEACYAMRFSRDLFVPPNIDLYGASVVDKNGKVYPGTFFGTCNYTPTNPIQSAVNNYAANLSTKNIKQRVPIDHLVIVGLNTKPSPLYKDRQFFTEIAEDSQALKGKLGTPLPIFLYEADNNRKPQKMWKTDSYEWMPFPFSPYHLGMEERILDSASWIEGIKKERANPFKE